MKVTENLERFAGFGGALGGHHNSLPVFCGERHGFFGEEPGNFIDDGVSESGIGASVDKQVVIEDEFGVRLGAGEELSGLLEVESHVYCGPCGSESAELSDVAEGAEVVLDTGIIER